MKPPKILIVEDNELHAENISFLAEKLNYQIVGLVNNANDCLDILLENKPNLVLLDIHIQGRTNGIELAEKIKQTHNIPIIYTTSLVDKYTIENAIKTQPEAYLNKPIEERTLATSVEIALFKNRTENKISKQKDFVKQQVKELEKKHQLTIREMDLLLFLISSYDNTEIAEKMFISVSTVKFHTRNLYEKLNISSRAELTAKFIQLD